MLGCRSWLMTDISLWNRSIAERVDTYTDDTLARRDDVARVQPDPFHTMVVDECAIGAPQVAKLTQWRIDLNHEVVARQRHILGHRAMHESRTPHDERVVPIEY